MKLFRAAALLYICNISLILICTNAFIVTSTTSKDGKCYPTKVNNELVATYCSEGNACNLIHKRIWFPSVVERLCSCVEVPDCPDNWSDEDGYTMFINPRAQLKFCNPITKLPTCTRDNVALTSILHNRNTPMVTPNCFCPKNNYLKPHGYQVSGVVKTTQTFTCMPLQHCNTYQFCGYITTDTFQTYYVCTCPPQHLCLYENKEKWNVREALYEGEAYRGICTPW